MMPGGVGSGRGIVYILLAVIVLWLASGLYRVLPDEQGVVLRFGRYVYTTPPGLHLRWPSPIESVLTPKVTRVNRLEVGFRSGAEGAVGRGGGARQVPEEALMLTGDENIVDINFTVFWLINDATRYLFNIKNPESTVKAVAESAVREVVGRTPIAAALAEGRGKIENDTQKLLQEILDSYGAGISVTQVQLQKVDPPAPVIDAFRDVQRARADQERKRNEAEAYRNSILPGARGDSVRLVPEAEAYKVQRGAEYNGKIGDRGMHVKLPFIQSVIYYDRRVLDTDPPTEEVIAADQKRLVVDSYARFRIVDPLQFYQSMGTEQAARGRLNATISGSLRRVLGNITLGSVLSDERSKIMRQITDEVAIQAKPFGIDVIDVRLRRADLPEGTSQAIFARLQDDRQREAQEFRAQADEFAHRIRSVAERERTVIIAEAPKQSQILRGQGEGESVKIHADAFGKDRNFFAFYRSMQAYREALGGQNTTLVLSPDNDFFRFFGSADGKGGSAGNGNAKP